MSDPTAETSALPKNSTPPQNRRRRRIGQNRADSAFGPRGTNATGGFSSARGTSERSVVQKGYLPFNREYIARLPYAEDYAITAAVATGVSAGTYTYTINNTYDPRFDIGGHQPLQYDILAAVYQRVWDLGAEVELTFTNPTADGAWVGYRLYSNLDTVASFGQTLSYLEEMGDTVLRPLNNSGGQVVTFRFNVDNANLLGLSHTEYANLDYSHATNASPAVYCYLSPFVMAKGAEDVTVHVNLKIWFKSRFTGRITAPQS